MTDFPRLIEHAFPLKQASLDSVHEKNVRHGHISTLHIWPARRPLAACRAALIATLLPDPGDPEKRRELCERIGGKVVRNIEKKKMPSGQTVERIKEATKGGILHWLEGEPDPKNKKKWKEWSTRKDHFDSELEWFRREIRKAYGGRAPKVLDPFAGGGAIPLEAMRLGCEATAIDINPVAWFILKCTLEYPQKLAGQTRPLPEFILHDDAFMAAFFKKARRYGAAETTAALKRLHQRLKKKAKPSQKGEQAGLPFAPVEGSEADELQADLAWQVRAWGQWVLDRARRELAQYYPTYADFEPIKKDLITYERRPMRLVSLKDDGTPDIDALNADFTRDYLEDKRNPRWIAKPTVAYLWARTVTCKNCRAIVPLLKTRWLCKKSNKRVLLTMKVEDVEQASVPASDPGHCRKLPHLHRSGATYFITWRLNKQQSDLLPPERDLVVQAFKKFDRQRYNLLAWVVMNDHVHVVVHPAGTHSLSQITHSWKSYTANQLQRQHGRRGAVWQDESWDRIVRHEQELKETSEYIRANPAKRWPEYENRDYPWVGAELDLKMAGTEACPTIKRVVFGVETNVPAKGGNAAQKREHDKRISAGTMSRAGAKCPCCGAIMTIEDLRAEGKAGRLCSIMTAVVVDGTKGKEYRLPTEHELAAATLTKAQIEAAFEEVPFGVPDEPTPAGGGSGAGRAFSVQGYGLMKWRDLFTPRQLMALGRFVAVTRAARDAMTALQVPSEWIEAIGAYLACGFDRMLDFNAATLSWITSVEAIGHTFVRFALPITWDYCESAPINPVRGGWHMCLGAVMESQPTLIAAGRGTSTPSRALKQSAIQPSRAEIYDAIVTDPPYYDAIPYSDLMDYFYIWQRRTLAGLCPAIDGAHVDILSSKWDHDANDGELIDDASRHGNDAAKSKQLYEDGMARVFMHCAAALKPEGRLVIVFANKQPDAWETLVSAIIRAGFVVDGSWPIETEQAARMRAQSSAALASSVWLVGKKRPATARPGWDSQVLEEMRTNIAEKLREFWDAGIRGPDFVWAATGPALEAYSKHPVVRKANEQNAVMTVTEFLTHVRRMVVDYIVGQVLTGEQGADPAAADRLDEVTAYYLLHRHDFGMGEAPVGACILYATACGLSDSDLERTWDILTHAGGDARTRGRGDAEDATDAEIEEDDGDGGSGSNVRLKAWTQRRGRNMGYEAPEGKAVPLIDRLHRVMHLWKDGDVQKVDAYLDDHALRRNELFRRVVQSLIELSESSERPLLESISNHIEAKGARRDRGSTLFEVASVVPESEDTE